MRTRLTKDELTAAREWIKDCIGSWRDIDDADQVDEMSDIEIERGIAKHYCGGVDEFKRSMGDV